MTAAVLNFNFIDLIDILLVGWLIYQAYKLIRGTVAIKIFFGILGIYLVWKLVTALQMEMFSEILGQFIGVGVIALLIVFQQELRHFLVVIGNRDFLKGTPAFLRKWFGAPVDANAQRYGAIVTACRRMAEWRR